MERTILYDLRKWKESAIRKPLILEGARQVGKTWSLLEFGRRHYEDIAYINFEEERAMRGLFKQDYDVERILRAIRTFTGSQCVAGKTLIIMDEIQEAEGGLTALKYFCERAREQHIAVAGSLLGIEMHRGASFPVGKANILKVFPMTFLEFLKAMDKHSWAEAIERRDWESLSLVHEKINELLKYYYYVGGMPEAVDAFSKGVTMQEVRQIQLEILEGYERDFSKHAPIELVPRIESAWNSLPRQLSRENRKFLFGLVKEGARAREYELSLQWLKDSGLIYVVYNLEAPRLPLKSYQDSKAFKVFVHDVGLLGAMCRLDSHTLIEGSRVFTEFRGALTEQYALQQLIPNCEPYHWAKPNSQQEVDFILENKNEVNALEIKAEENLRSQSLKSFMADHPEVKAFRASMKPYRQEKNLTNIPLYGLGSLYP
ncbi:MAG: ATP-binding protein [Bacteroidales bacterium]|nr:ATP-binding protein [Bacteroidales bacterium]